MKNFAQAKLSAEFHGNREQHSTSPDSNFPIFPVLLSLPQFRNGQRVMKKPMSERTTIHLMNQQGRRKNPSHIESGSQSCVTDVKSLTAR